MVSSHTDYRRSVMDARAIENPQAAVGGLWDEMGQLQVHVLKELGLVPSHELLDIGCGSLRGGIPLIDYLSPGKYWGTDISPELLKAGIAQLEKSGLVDKNPTLRIAIDFSLKEVGDRKFDFIQAFGVFTDVPRGFVEECLESVSNVLSPEGIFIATFGAAEKYSEDHRHLRFRYPLSFFKSLESRVGMDIKFMPNFSFRHPKGHSLLLARRKR